MFKLNLKNDYKSIIFDTVLTYNLYTKIRDLLLNINFKKKNMLSSYFQDRQKRSLTVFCTSVYCLSLIFSMKNNSLRSQLLMFCSNRHEKSHNFSAIVFRHMSYVWKPFLILLNTYSSDITFPSNVYLSA